MIEQHELARVGAASDDVAGQAEERLDLDTLQMLTGVLGGELHLDVGPGKIRSSYRASSSTITRGSAPATEPTSAPRSRIS